MEIVVVKESGRLKKNKKKRKKEKSFNINRLSDVDKNIKKILETFYLNNSGRIFTKRGLIDTLLQLILK